MYLSDVLTYQSDVPIDLNIMYRCNEVKCDVKYCTNLLIRCTGILK